MTLSLPLTKSSRDWLGLTPIYWVRSRWGRLGLVVLTGLIYLGLGKVAFKALALPMVEGMALFPSVGVGAGLVVIFGADALLGMMLGAFWLGLALGSNSWIALLSGLRLGIFGGLFSYLLQRYQVDCRLRRLRDVWGLLVLSIPIAIAVNTSLACMLDVGSYHSWQLLSKSWRTVFIADLVSVLMLTPCLMIVATTVRSMAGDRLGLRQRWALWRRHQGLEFWVWLIFTLFVGLRHVDSQTGRLLLESLPFLSLTWAAVRFGIVITVCASVWINSVEIVRVLHRQGVFFLQADGDLNVALLMLQTFIAVMVIVGLCLAALTEERQTLMGEIQQEGQFDRLILDIANQMGSSLDIQEIMDIAVQKIYAILQADRVYVLQVMLDGSTRITAEACGAKWQTCLGTVHPHPHTIVELYQWYRDRGIEVTADLAMDNQLHPLTVQFCQQLQVQARVAVPILVDGTSYGLLSVHQCRGPRHWTAQEINFLEHVVVPLGVSLHQVLLYQQERDLVAELDRQVRHRTDELQRSLVAQELLNEGKTRLLHAVSHDLRTPIVGSLLVLRQMSKRHDGLAGKMIRQLQESSERQLSLIQALLEDYCAEDATLRFHFQTIDYGALIDRSLLTLSPILAEHHAQLVVQIAPGLPAIQADPLHIQRVLENLITNALKHNATGLTIQLEAQIVQVGAIDYLRCVVADDGVGLPPGVVHRLFARPYLRSVDGSERQGLGLGLYLAYQIVTAHGGQLQVDTGAMVGARFVFTLPIACVPAEVVMQPPLLGRTMEQTAVLMTELEKLPNA